jgi:hypothetical protein
MGRERLLWGGVRCCIYDYSLAAAFFKGVKGFLLAGELPHFDYGRI